MATSLLGLLVVAAAAGGEAWRDGFDGAALNPRWRKVVPVGGPTFSLIRRSGWLRIVLPAREEGFSHWVNEQKSPLLLADAPKGDFVYEGRVMINNHSPEGSVHAALIVAFSEGHVLAWGPYYSRRFGGGQKTPEVWAEITGLGGYLKAPGDGQDAHLRIERNDRRYTLSTKRREDDPWKTIGTFDAAFPPRYVGVMAKTFGPPHGATIDVDYASLTPKPASPPQPFTATARISADKPDVVLSPLRYGHFAEHLHNCFYGGFWAERLRNRKFTGRADGGVVEGWRPLGEGKGVQFSPDNGDYYCPAQAQAFQADADGPEHGIAQDGIVVEAGRAYTGYVIAKQRGLTGPVTVSLRAGDRRLASVEVGPITTRWQKLPFRLEATASAKNGALAITAKSAGRLWLGAVSLMPADHVHGWRRDVIEAARLCRPPILRYPGGNFVSGYHWRDGIGPRDRRPPRFDRAWKLWEWNDVGIDEFMTLTRLVGWQPYVVVNCGEGQADEAAEWVEYCNGGRETRWGKVRAANGHPEPYGVKYWGIGNEIYGPWQLGHLDATRYALKAVEFARAMKAVDPTIKLIGVGVVADQFDRWNETVVKIAGECFDWLSVHHYVLYDPRGDRVGGYLNVVHAPVDIERMLARTADIVRRAHGGRPIPLAFDEWNVAGHPFGGTGKPWRHTLARGICAAGVFHALHRLGDRVTMANLALMVNVLGLLQVRQTDLLQTPTYLAFRMYANAVAHRRVPVALADVPTTGRTPLVDVIAGLSEDGRTLYVHALNRHPLEPISVTWALSGFAPAGPVRVMEITGTSWDAQRTFARRDDVRLTERQTTWDQIRGEPLGPHSIRTMVIEGR